MHCELCIEEVMTLVKSISGIRGTIGGTVGEGLSPVDIVRFTTGYAEWLKCYRNKSHCTVVVGRDARLSGTMVSNIVIGTLMGCGCNVVNIGLATTPTTELAVTLELSIVVFCTSDLLSSSLLCYI